MTRTRYAIAVLLQSFGVVRKNRRMTDAAYEMHLMQDGEEILGAFCWRNIEDIEEISMEYWNLRKLEREEDAILKKVNKAEKTLSKAQSERADLVDRSKDIGQELLQKRESLFETIEEINVERDELMLEAQQTKRKHSALKMKSKVLKEEEEKDQGKIDECRQSLAELRTTFTESKKRLVEINDKVETLEEELTILQKEIDEKLKGSKGEATEAFAQISKANRDITKFQAELGLLQEEQGKLYREVGRFLNLNSNRPDCKAACKDHRGIQEQTRLLSRSINWNRALVDRLTK